MSDISSITNATMKATSVNYVSNGGSYEMEPFSEKDSQATIFASAKDMGTRGNYVSWKNRYSSLYKYVYNVDEIPENDRADDLIYGDRSNAPTLINGAFWNLPAGVLETIVSSLKIGAGKVGVGPITIYEKDPKMSAVFDNMFAHFYEGSGDTYTDKYLESKVIERTKTTDFVNQSLKFIRAKLWSKEVRGHLSKLNFDPMERLKERVKKADAEANRKYPSEEMIEKYTLYQLAQEYLAFPKYNEGEDLINGLGILIHDICAAKIHIYDFKINTHTWACMGKYRFSMYDDFGLDLPDISPTKWATYYPGIQAWFVLQHNQRFGQAVTPCYKPFINVFEIEDSFIWNVPEKYRAEISADQKEWFNAPDQSDC